MPADRIPNWVFLRGLVRESAHWDDFPARFAAAVPGGEPLLLDLPGNGRHWRLPSPCSLRETMEFARREVLGRVAAGTAPAGPVCLLAISLGGMVAVEWMRHHPDEVSAAVLVNTSLRSFSPWYQRLRWSAWPDLIGIILQGDAARRERAVLALTTGHAAANGALVAARVNAWKERPVRRANVLRQLIAAARYRPPRQAPRMPVLLLSGLGDRLVDPSCSAAIARAWHLAHRCHPVAGHDLPLDDPDWTIAAVRDWLEQRPQAGDRTATLAGDSTPAFSRDGGMRDVLAGRG